MTETALKARSQTGGGDHLDARPLVASKKAPASPWLFVAAALLLGTVLFLILNNAREERNRVEPAEVGAAANPETVPNLVLPPAYNQPPQARRSGNWSTPFADETASGAQQSRRPVAYQAPVRVRAPRPSYTPAPSQAPYYSQPAPSYSAPPPLSQYPQASTPLATQQATERGSSGPIKASRSVDPATTILQGSTIQAVLESALDSTAPGQVRALVTRDVHSADGTRVLIPRGSRLYGTYAANVSDGQKRLQVRWTRLIRPDMVSVAIDSPAADPLGRAGVGGKVNSHFLPRLGNALLSSTFTLGGLLASRSASPVIVAVPGSVVPQVTQQGRGQGSEIRPTLTVRQGSRVAVFVQQDIEFSEVVSGS